MGTNTSSVESTVVVHPVTPDRWGDLESLFERKGPRGGLPIPGHCWCMAWRDNQPSKAVRKAGMRALVADDRQPGLLAYLDGRPVGWVSVGPRAEFGALGRSRQLRPQDEDGDVHSIVCFFVDTDARGTGVAGALLDAAIEAARAAGATAVEAYPKTELAPHAVKGGRPEQAYSFMGRRQSYETRGFTAVREAGTRSVLRLELRGMSEARFEALVGDSVGGPVTSGVMFGARGLRTGKKFFAAWWTGKLLVKLPPDRIEAIEAAGQGEVFVARNRPMKNWVLLNDTADWTAISQEARAFVEGG